jgi:rhodanese-related sulfurtransferase
MTVDDLLEAARARIQRATPAEAQRALDEGAVLVDLRCPGERSRTGMIPGSIAIARSVLEWRADPASPWRDDRIARPDARVLLLCEQGYSSSLAAASLCDLGFERPGDVVGGMERWLAEARRVEPAPDTG